MNISIESTNSTARASYVSSNGISGTIENRPAWKAIPRTAPLSGSNSNSSSSALPSGICADYVISSDALHALKLAASPSSKSTFDEDASASTYISTHDAISALLWHSIMRARHQAGVLDKNAAVYAIFPIDCRARLGLPTPYYGNAVYTTRIAIPLPTLIESTATNTHDSGSSPISGLQIAALTIRNAVSHVIGDLFLDFLGFVERNDGTMAMHMAGFEDLGSSNMLLTSYYGFDHHRLDFGPALGGRIEAFRIPAQGLLPGMQFLLPRLPNGGCEFVVFDSAEVVGRLDADEFLKQFAVRQG